jgi:TolA-binding protein
MMKRVLSGLAMMSLLVGTAAFAENAETPGIDQRQANQERRIDQGVASGQLTEREANRLNRQQEHVNKMEDRAKADGVVTNRERAKIHGAQDRASRNIARQKHDRQHR